MSEMGQNRKWPDFWRMSVLPKEGDIVRPTRHVRFVPTTDSCSAAKNRVAVGARGGGLGRRFQDQLYCLFRPRQRRDALWRDRQWSQSYTPFTGVRTS